MLKHSYAKGFKPARVVILGARGFIAGAIRRQLENDGITTLAIGRPTMDLLAPEAIERLEEVLTPDDTLIIVSAKAPCKGLSTLRENLLMVETVCAVLQRSPVAHVIYLSSDAVYKDSTEPLTELSCAEPNSLHGVMHLAREVALRQVHSGPLAILRPTLVYGFDDPHNGYGPNLFRRQAAAGNEIVLFGEGEEQRDHVDVGDVAELVRLLVVHRSEGIANAVSGQVASFCELAEFVSQSFPTRVPVRSTLRSGSMPHNGYRAFDNHAVLSAFPSFSPKMWREGLSAVHWRQMSEEKLK